MTAEHVSPALVVPTPVVSTDLGLSLVAKRRNWLLPQPGSPGHHRHKEHLNKGTEVPCGDLVHTALNAGA